MRVIIGLLALAAYSNAQTVTPSGSANGVAALTITPGQNNAALAAISAYIGTTTTGSLATVTPTPNVINSATNANTGNYFISVPNSVSAVTFLFTFNQYVAQVQYRSYVFGTTAPAYICDLCSNPTGAAGSTTSCNTGSGPGISPSPASGYLCSTLARTYVYSGLTASTPSSTLYNNFQVQLWDRIDNVNSYSFQITRFSPPIVGDPQIIGLQGQDFQVHGMPDEIFNMITYPNLQVNARFVYLSSGSCHDNYTACFAHPGTYISEEGIRLGGDKIHVMSGSFKKGLTVKVNGKKLIGTQSLKLGSVELVNHRRVSIRTPIMSIQISNSDKFLNQETTLFDQKLLALGSDRRILSDNEQFHAEVPLHGLQGQTWRNVEYPSGLDYEGSISDYHITDGNLFGTSFVFNQFKHE